MSAQIRTKPVEEVVAAIEALDLGQIKFKLMHPDAGKGWSQEVVDTLERDYKRFLTLHAKYPGTEIVPSNEIDQFWHAHILDTMKYAQDCEQTFGYFLHHFPYLGLRGEGDAEHQELADQETKRLYEREFGEPMQPTGAAFCSVAGSKEAAFCSLAAKPAFCSLAAKKEAAFCSVAAKPAFCSVAAKSAFCSVAAKKEAAFCSLAAKPAFCSVAAKKETAFCSLAAKPAFCSVAAKPAFCSVAVKNDAAFCSVAIQAQKAFCSVAARRVDLETSTTLALAA